MNLHKVHIVALWLLSVLMGQSTYAAIIPVDEVSKHGIKLIENKGQWDPEILFKGDIPGGFVFVTPTGIVYQLMDQRAYFEAAHDRKPNTTIKGHVFKVGFAGGNASPSVKKQNASSEYYNYFIGNDRAKWQGGCRAYSKVTLQNIYTGIDLEIIALEARLKLNFIVHAFADPNRIQLVYEGADALKLINNSLHVTTSVAEVHELEPVSVQPDLGVHKIASAYVLNKNSVSFSVGHFNPAYDLVIDPEVVFATFSGSFADNWGYSATFDANGNAYSGGTVHDNADFRIKPGAFQTVWAGGSGFAIARDCGILKYTPDGKDLLFATYIGGSNNEGPHSMVCDSSGNLFIMGATWSTNFPVTAGSFDNSQNGRADLYVCKLSADGTTMLASTYIGGSQDDGLNGDVTAGQYNPLSIPLAYNYGDYFRGEIMMDGNSGVYVVSSTFSSAANGFPLVNAFDGTLNGGQDGCIIKLNAALNAIAFSSYIGGNGFDAAYGLAIDNFQNVYVTGGTTSSDFGPSTGDFKHHGNVDGYVARITGGGSLVKVICYGTPSYDQSYLIQLDNAYNIYITGQTEGNLPTKGDVSTVAGSKQFITSFNRNLDSVRISTNFGVSGTTFPQLSPAAFLVDLCSRVYVSGWGGDVNTSSFNFNLGGTQGLFLTNDAFQKSTDGSDFYLIVFAPELKSVSYATYIGGNQSSDHVDGGTSRFDKHGVVYQSVCGGCRGFSDFPTTPGAWSTKNNSTNCNNALLKMDLNVNGLPPFLKDTLFGATFIKDTLLYVTATDTLVYAFDIRDPQGATITTELSGSMVANASPAMVTLIQQNPSSQRVRIRIPTGCSDIGDTLVLEVNSINNNCPNPKSNKSFIRVFVKPLLDPAAPYPQCVKFLDDSIIQLHWDKASSLQKHLQSVHIYRKTNTDSFALFRTLFNTKDTLGFDTQTMANITANNYCYYLVYEDICGNISDPSRTICTKYKEDTAIVPGYLFKPDTTLFVNAFDTLLFIDTLYDSDPHDSNFVYTSSSDPKLAIVRKQGLGYATVMIKWITHCNDITANDTPVINMVVYDNQCPTPRIGNRRIKIVVLSPPVSPPPPLHCIRKLNDTEVEISWNTTVWSKYIDHFALIRKNPDNSYTHIRDILTPDITSVSNMAADNETINYCYALYPVSVCNTIGDTSVFQCTQRKDTDFPGSTYIYTVTVANNNHIELNWQRSADPLFSGFNVYRHTLTNAAETLIAANVTDSSFSDQTVNVHKQSYCYKIRQVNNCGLLSKTPGDEACTILLQGKSNPFEHSMSWNPYIYWPAGNRQNDMMRMQPGIDSVLLASVPGNDTAFMDENLDIENGLYLYSVTAREGFTGYDYSSTSNMIELIQLPIVYTPNVFSPNSDGTNDRWVPRPVFVKDYNVKLYNRWGQLVFETNNKHETFDATHKGEIVQEDAYVYLITYTGWDNSSHVQRGNVTVLR